MVLCLVVETSNRKGSSSRARKNVKRTFFNSLIPFPTVTVVPCNPNVDPVNGALGSYFDR